MPRFLILVVALALVLPPQAAAQSPAAAPGGLLISTAELAAAAKDPSLVVLHVADRASAFEEAHIPGARFLRYGDFAVDGDQSVGSELPAGRGGQARVRGRRRVRRIRASSSTRPSPVAAARAFFTLDAIGHRHVALLDGGLARLARREACRSRQGPRSNRPAASSRRA